MGTGMSTRLYPLSGGDGDETKVWYPLSLDMKMWMNFFYENVYRIVKLVLAPPLVIPVHCILKNKNTVRLIKEYEIQRFLLIGTFNSVFMFV